MPTKIEWTDEVYNPVTGCTKVSEGCKNCYAERMCRRFWKQWDREPPPDHFRVKLHPDRLKQPSRWKKPRRVFVCSMSDLFHPEITNKYRLAVYETMMSFGQPQHTYQVLTKRPAWAAQFFSWVKHHVYDSPEKFDERWQMETSHIHLGTSIENQECADERIPLLLQTPAAVRFVSVEPMLSRIDTTSWFSGYEMVDRVTPSGKQLYRCRRCGDETPAPCKWPYHECVGIDWVIIGCESGPGRRPMLLRWAIDLVRQCKAASVPVFVKQVERGGYVSHDPAEWPEELRVREYPNAAA